MKKIKIILLMVSLLATAPVIFAESADKNNEPEQNNELLSWINLGHITVSQNGEGQISYTGDLYMAKMGNVLVYQLRIDDGEEIKNYVVQPFDSKQFNAVTYINGPTPYYLNVPAWYSLLK